MVLFKFSTLARAIYPSITLEHFAFLCRGVWSLKAHFKLFKILYSMAAQPRTPCKFFIQKRCDRGEACLYPHDQESSSTGIWRSAAASSSSHENDPNLTSVTLSASTGRLAPNVVTDLTGKAGILVPCEFFKNGNCYYGVTCRFAHISPGASRSSEMLPISHVGTAAPGNVGHWFYSLKI